MASKQQFVNSVNPNSALWVVRYVIDSIIVLGFWASIVLPAIYLPLFLSGINTNQELFIFLSLFAGHVAALYIGQGYRQP